MSRFRKTTKISSRMYHHPEKSEWSDSAFSSPARSNSERRASQRKLTKRLICALQRRGRSKRYRRPAFRRRAPYMPKRLRATAAGRVWRASDHRFFTTRRCCGPGTVAARKIPWTSFKCQQARTTFWSLASSRGCSADGVFCSPFRSAVLCAVSPMRLAMAQWYPPARRMDPPFGEKHKVVEGLATVLGTMIRCFVLAISPST